MAVVSGIGRIPLFNGENYSTWRPQMEGILHKARLLKYVNGKEKKPEDIKGESFADWIEKDLDARSELLVSMESAQVALIKNFKSSKEIWDYLEETYDRKSTRQKAEEFRKLVNTRMDSSQTMDEYLREFGAIVTRLTEMDAKLDEDLLVTLLLDSLPDTYKEVQAAFDAAKEFPSLQVVRVRLMEIGDRKREESGTAMQVNNFYHKKRTFFKNSTGGQTRVKESKPFPYNCRKCGKRGHKAQDCWSNNNNSKRQEKAHQSDSQQCGFVMQECLTVHSKYMRNKVQAKGKTWCLDSGTTSHMCRWEDSFVSLVKRNHGCVNLANNQKLDVLGIGTVKLNLIVENNIKTVYLYDTLFVPGMKESLISVGKATEKKCEVVFDGQLATIKSEKGEKLMTARKCSGLFMVTEEKIESTNVTVRVDPRFIKWHCRFGHLNAGSLKKLQRDNMVVGLSNFKEDKLDCVTCIRGKQTRLPFPSKGEKTSTARLQIVHSDICGPMRTE